ncbi:M24 family metallopeptidase [Bradyrhizobium sp. USDA 4529]
MSISKGPQAFPRAEYLRRVAAVKKRMERLDVDALFVSSPANLTYLTGSMVVAGPQGLVISMDKELPTYFIRRADAAAVIHQSFLERENLYLILPENRAVKPGVDGWDAAIDYLYEAGLATRGVALELNHLVAEVADKFKRRLPQARVVDSEMAATWVRLIKSDLEIAVMREAAGIADAAIMRASEVIRPGVREADVIAEIVATQARGAKGKPGTSFAPIGPVFMCSSPRTGAAHIQWSEDHIQSGSHINLEVCGSRHGYVTPLMRTFSVGAPSDRLRRVHEAELAGLEAALEAVRPGASCSDVARAFYRESERLGVSKDTRCGYSVGIDWFEPTLSLNETESAVLAPNMTFHLMLGNWMEEDFGYVISETIRVTESGVEVLTSVPRTLFEI